MSTTILEKVSSLKAELALLEKEAKAAREQRAQELSKTLRYQFKYEVISVEDLWVDVFGSLKRVRPEDPEFSKKKITVKRTFVNKDEIWQKITEAECTVINFPDEEAVSCDYFMYHNVLLHKGGGWIFFDTPSMITNEEWKMFENGIIPERLIPSEGDRSILVHART